MIKGKGQMNCYWVNESKNDAKTDALERLEARRKLRILESSIQNWDGGSDELDIEKGQNAVPEQAPNSSDQGGFVVTRTQRGCELSTSPEQAPVFSGGKLATLAESSSEFRLGEDEGSADFVQLEGDLMSRLGRAKNKPNADYFV